MDTSSSHHRVRRRTLLGGALSLAVLPASAQRPRRLALFSPSDSVAIMREDSADRYYRALFEELRRLGHVEGQALAVERYGREQMTAGPDALAADVIRSAPDVVYVVGPVTYFMGKTTTLPIVAITSDPIALGLATSLARPGGNVTGVSVDTGPSIYGKRIQLLHEVVPGLKKLAYLGMRIAWEKVQGDGMRAAAAETNVTLVPVLLELPTSETAYRAAIDEAARQGVDAIMVGDSADTMANQAVILAAIAEAGLPAMHTFPEAVHAGGLMAYSFDLVELNRRVAADLDAILRGGRAGDIPFYQATTFVLSINHKTAKRLRLTFPPAIVAGADDIVD